MAIILHPTEAENLHTIQASAQKQNLTLEEITTFNGVLESHLSQLPEELAMAYAIICSMIPSDGAQAITPELQQQVALLAQQFLAVSTIAAEVEHAEDAEAERAEIAYEKAILAGDLGTVQALFDAEPCYVSPHTCFNSGLSAIALAWETDGAEEIFNWLIERTEIFPYTSLAIEAVRPPTLQEEREKLENLCGHTIVSLTIAEGLDYVAIPLLEYHRDKLKREDIATLEAIASGQLQHDDDAELAEVQAERERQAREEATRRAAWEQRVHFMKAIIPLHTTVRNEDLNAYLCASGLFARALTQNVIILPTHAMPSAFEKEWLLQIAAGERMDIHTHTGYSAAGDLGSVTIEVPAKLIIIPICIHSTHYGLAFLHIGDDKQISHISYLDPKPLLFGTRGSLEAHLFPHLAALVDGQMGRVCVAGMGQIDNEVECALYCLQIIRTMIDLVPDSQQNPTAAFNALHLPYESCFTLRCCMAHALGLEYFRASHGEEHAEARFADAQQTAGNSNRPLFAQLPPNLAAHLAQRIEEEQQQLEQQQALEAQFAAAKEKAAAARLSSIAEGEDAPPTAAPTP